MGQKKLGAFIRQIDYLNAKDGNDYENSDDNPGNQLIDVEKQCKDISFDDLKDAHAAFEEKVCINGFPERHSPAYWVAYSTVCVLNRLTSDFIDDHEEMLWKVSAVQLHTLVALIEAGPTTTHTELFNKMINNNVKEYAKSLGTKDLAPLMSAAKVTFKYIPNDDCNEYYYGYFQHGTMKRFFQMFSTEQYKLIQKEFLETYVHYLSQMSSLPEQYGNQINDVIRDMGENFEENNPYLGLNHPETIKKHMDVIKVIVSGKDFTENSPADHSVEQTLKTIFQAVLKDGYLPEVFDHIVCVITELNQNDNFRKEGKNIYERYIYQLFRSLKDHEIPLEKLYKPCVDLVTALRSQGHMTTIIERLIDVVDDCVVVKVKKVTAENVEITLAMVVKLLESGRKVLIRQAESNLEHLKKIKALDWRKHVDTAKEVLETIGKMQRESMQDDQEGSLDDTVSAYKSFLRVFWEQLKKAKVLPQLQSSLVSFIFDCLTIDTPVKSELAEECSGRDNLDLSKEESQRIVVLEKAEGILKTNDVPWKDRYMGIALSSVLKQVVQSYNGNGKKVTEEENKLFVSIFMFVGEGGNSVTEHFYEEENEEMPNYKMLIWLSVLLPYARLHQETATLDCISPILPDIIRWAKIAHADDHDTMMNLCFGVLNWVGLATPLELKSSLGELLDLMLESGKSTEMYSLVNSLYPHNQNAVHSRLPVMFDKLNDMKENERQITMTMLYNISQKHPEAFSKKQITTMFEMYKKGNPSSTALILTIIKNIAEKYPQNIVDFFPQLCDDNIFKPDSMNIRSSILACVGGVDESLGQKTVDYLMKYIDHTDPTVSQIVIGTASSMMRKHKDYTQKYKPKLESLQQSSTVPQVRDMAHDMVLILEGKSVENIIDDIEQQREDIAELDTKVDSTIDTVITIGDKVVKHDQEIGDLQTGLENVEERVDDAEEDLGETKVKLEEIDNKTMTNAPKWSRDLTKLMNPTAENDWRLLASRLGYNNDEIRGWASHHDPCMALLSEWYATHKTSEANYGVLTALTEMNRLDGVVIVENAMKTAEGVVEDEEFEYASPPAVFLSYQWGFQNEVQLLKHHLNMAGYECWMDVGQMGGGDKLFAKIDNGIRGAKVVICCVTEKYAQSPNCNREVNLSVNLNKPIIPLLMEKMDWPPKGSMGPIFSEYLFIRFFQRGGEETPESDQRYWPIPKFQELLMQLNFFAAPDQTMIKNEYAKWWAPMVEDIVIDKNKGTNKASTQKQKQAPTQDNRFD